MTQPPPKPPLELSYQTVGLYRNAPTLVLLAVIFNYVSASLDLLYGLGSLGISGFVFYIFKSMSSLPATSSAPRPSPPEPWLALIYAIPVIPSIAAATIKFIGANRIRRRSYGYFGWGLAAGIIGCTEIWCSVFCMPACVLPLAAGIFTIVILCLEHVRAYLAAPRQTIPGAFPI